MISVKGSPLILLLFFISFHFCLSIDTITPNQSLEDGDVLVSSGGSFALGFFDFENSSHRFVGIWYNKVPVRTVVWVANRDRSVNGTSGVLVMNSIGNLALFSRNGTASDVPIWSTNVSSSTTSKFGNKARLLDSGNLVLVQQDTEMLLWQSFDYPTNTLLPNMKLGLDRKTGLNRILSSWKSVDDPGKGNVSLRIDPVGFPQLFLYKGSDRFWRAGPWTGQRWSGVPEMTRNFIFNSSFVNNNDEVSLLYGLKNKSIISIMVVEESGILQRSTWNNNTGEWIQFWSDPKEQCDYYNQCGKNSICDPYDPDKFICKCLPGFEPKSPRDWYLRDGSGGCVRKSNVSTCHNGEGFEKLARVKVPDTSVARVDMNLSLKECERECLSNCSCTAYTSGAESGLGCLSWYGDLIDTRTYSTVGQDIYVRVDAVELAKYGKLSRSPLAKQGVQAIIIVFIAVFLFLVVLLFYCLIKRKRKARERRRNLALNFAGESTYLEDSSRKEIGESGRRSDLPFFDVSAIVEATNNFSHANKLGEGGFGSVYKGVLYNGREVAVKRLSKYSGQGNEEFKSEVTLIAKLQHRNLVKIIGCCIQRHEKMLIYEYLPNKSLDSFIFDERKRGLLNWQRRHEIICGIGRGLLYLHQDSRLRIIHRDLKASNVLLDASMNPKISDFGMARIFGGDQTDAANTNRIVGTYGYMSPEYAMQGIFSVKSDVYSFGVLTLEIISGRKNSSYYEETTSSSLVGYVWELWTEGRAFEIADPTLIEHNNNDEDDDDYDDNVIEAEVTRCIQIGLLCVQESALERPNMSNVVFMLSNHNIELPLPKKPAFILKTPTSGSYSKNSTSGDPSTSEGVNSVNDVTLTMPEGR